MVESIEHGDMDQEEPPTLPGMSEEERHTNLQASLAVAQAFTLHVVQHMAMHGVSQASAQKIISGAGADFIAEMANAYGIEIGPPPEQRRIILLP